MIDATAELIAGGGADDATIMEITATAGLATGTFYNHFKDRAEIIAETAINIMEQISASINSAGLAEEDIVVRLAAGTRRFLDITYDHPTWAWAVLRAIDYLPSLRPRVYQYIGSTVRIGHEIGEFSDEDDFTLHIISSMLFAAARSRLSGQSGPETGARVAEMQLRVLGVDPARAHEAANRPVADVELAWNATPAVKGARLQEEDGRK
ncbi:MAG TPA: TetR/AcrR family transcriptional regulator [Phenylobacterium sp.]|uniref:TetR/AcrR family transcriptional regulator n=1 Tax=Phenylobacterium sp. TaxID=1871053 RepID=UPI002B49EFB4|nr:TetR/AcrR family transcriptional regulator [Phenylobacterium sp.]HKR90218.1 TetR/AcrR family transcriptional regulator [Phenylobacterium sp.]